MLNRGVLRPAMLSNLMGKRTVAVSLIAVILSRVHLVPDVESEQQSIAINIFGTILILITLILSFFYITRNGSSKIDNIMWDRSEEIANSQVRLNFWQK